MKKILFVLFLLVSTVGISQENQSVRRIDSIARANVYEISKDGKLKTKKNVTENGETKKIKGQGMFAYRIFSDKPKNDPEKKLAKATYTSSIAYADETWIEVEAAFYYNQGALFYVSVTERIKNAKRTSKLSQNLDYTNVKKPMVKSGFTTDIAELIGEKNAAIMKMYRNAN